MKFAVSSYSFSQAVKDGRLNTLSLLEKAKELGFDAVEYTSSDCPVEKAPAIKAEADKLGIQIVNYCTGAELLTGDTAAAVESLKRNADTAAFLGCATMRHDVTGGYKPRTWQGYDTALPILAENCRKVTEYAETLGVKTMTENHGYFSQDSLRVEKLINTVASDNFGQLVDMGNFLCADDEPLTAVSRCAPYAFYVHAKDFLRKSGDIVDPGEGFFMTRGGEFLRGTIIGHGAVPVLQCMRALKRAGYDGYVSIEFEGMEDCINAIRIGLANLKRYDALL